jgi:putative sterol carrier protein
VIGNTDVKEGFGMALAYGTDEWLEEYNKFVEEGLSAGPPYILGLPEWVSTYEKLVQGDELYKEAAKTWEGSVVIHILAKPEIGIDRDIYIFMDLWHGEANYFRLVPPEVGESGAFVITGEYERWKQVMKKELDTVKGMMQGKLKLKGDLPTIVRAVKAAVRLVDLSAMIDSTFEDEDPEAPQKVRDLLARAENLGI